MSADAEKEGEGRGKAKRKAESTEQPKSKHRQQSYRTEWEKDPSFAGWLRPVSGTDTKAFCRCCNVQIVAEITVLKNHEKSKKHQDKKKNLAPAQRSIAHMLQNTSENEQLDTAVKNAEIKLTGFMAEHNIALRTSDHLVEVLKDIFQDSKTVQHMSLGRTKTTAITKHVIGDCYFESLTEILKRKKFSVLIDESTDIGNVKTLCIVVRFFDDGTNRIQSRFWNLVQIYSDQQFATEGATAERLYNETMKSFTDADVPIENIVGFGSDDCNTMMGKNNSVSSRLKHDLPGITVQRCVCHSLHLCASEACKQLPRRCEDLARDIYGYFKNSAKRAAQLREFQDFCHVEPHKILKPSQTRWLSLNEVVKRLSAQWNALQLFFTEQWLEARLTAAENIFHSLNDESLRLFYYFLEWVLPKFTDLNQYFQSEKVVIASLKTKFCETYTDLLLTFMDRDYVLQTPLNQIDVNDGSKLRPLNTLYLGVKVMQHVQQSKIPAATLTDFHMRCRSFLRVACKEIKNRFDFDDALLTQIVCLSPATATDAKARAEHPSLLPLMQEVPRLIDMTDGDHLQAIDDQWRRLPRVALSDDTKTMDVDEFWHHISTLKDFEGVLVFSELGKFALDVLVFPHSNASCERVFSKVNLIKTKPRNRLITDTLNGLMHTSECVKNAGGCPAFKPTSSMLRSMTASNMYRKRTPSTSAVTQASDDSDSEVEFEPSH